jgi:hypothetical protein
VRAASRMRDAYGRSRARMCVQAYVWCCVGTYLVSSWNRQSNVLEPWETPRMGREMNEKTGSALYRLLLTHVATSDVVFSPSRSRSPSFMPALGAYVRSHSTEMGGKRRDGAPSSRAKATVRTFRFRS